MSKSPLCIIFGLYKTISHKKRPLQCLDTYHVARIFHDQRWHMMLKKIKLDQGRDNAISAHLKLD